MIKIDTILQIDKMEQVKNIAVELGGKEIIFSEVKLFNPKLQATKRYRGAEYQITEINKLKAEIILEEELCDEFEKRVSLLLDKTKGDSITFYEISRRRE